MANPPRKKGTSGETELLRLLDANGLTMRRTPAASTYDLLREGDAAPPPIEALATRPDRGRWLVTLRAEDFAQLVAAVDDDRRASNLPLDEVHVEVKRFARFSLHTIFEGKFA
jgi:hypothetical protein